MSKTLVLLFHPDITRSCANAALSTAASQLAEVEIFDVQQAYPNGVIDTDAEVHRLLGVAGLAGSAGARHRHRCRAAGAKNLLPPVRHRRFPPSTG